MNELIVIFNTTCGILILLLLIYWVVFPILSTPYMKSTIKDMLIIFELANLDREDRFIDLGSGDGRIVLAASRIADYAVGVEHNPFLTLYARFIALITPNGPLKFVHKSMYDYPLKGFNVVVAYLYPSSLKKLKDKLEAELEDGTRVVTNKYKIPGWKVSESRDDRYFLYVIGKHK